MKFMDGNHNESITRKFSRVIVISTFRMEEGIVGAAAERYSTSFHVETMYHMYHEEMLSIEILDIPGINVRDRRNEWLR